MVLILLSMLLISSAATLKFMILVGLEISGKPFTDYSLPSGYAPFNIQNIGGNLFVTYAKVSDEPGEEETGPGLGFVDIYYPNGRLIKRFASGGKLNAPWGVSIGAEGILGRSKMGGR